ncbi:VOC family protein [Chryseobacterium foetidum]|uniref:VOC family protein n=1 Tax=Chryseobacterium foetidum TaxID=2951057 RepID=UPI0021C7E5A9|nr:VOC family protein [Chryseobacterium foetidum]
MQFRYARHTQKLESLIYFYTSVLNFEILGEFKNHDNYDGVFLGIKGQNWHLEFTQNGEKPNSKFDEDDTLVFYPESNEDYRKILDNLKKFEVPLLQPKNPYWKKNGICFEDCDHYKIIVSDIKIR